MEVNNRQHDDDDDKDDVAGVAGILFDFWADRSVMMVSLSVVQ